MSPIAHDTLVDTLVNRLRDDVLTQRYRPGSKLPPERDLAASYGVTRTSLKHALVRLAQAGLVETRHGVGTVVLDYRRHGGPDLLPMLLAHALRDGADGPWLAEVFEVRQEVGANVAAHAASNGTADQVDALRAQLAAVTDAPGADAAQLAECELHRMLAAAAGNRVYELLINSLLRAYLEVRLLFRAPFTDPVVAGKRLAPLVDAVCAGDPDAARAAAEAYLAQTRKLMLGEQ